MWEKLWKSGFWLLKTGKSGFFDLRFLGRMILIFLKRLQDPSQLRTLRMTRERWAQTNKSNNPFGKVLKGVGKLSQKFPDKTASPRPPHSAARRVLAVPDCRARGRSNEIGANKQE